MSGIELVGVEEEVKTETEQEPEQRNNRHTTIRDIFNDNIPTRMDMELDIPQSTMLEYPSSPPAPAAPATPPPIQQQRRKAQPFSYVEDESDEEDINARKELDETSRADNPFDQAKTSNIPTKPVNGQAKRAGPFQEVDSDEDEDEMHELRVRLDKGKERAIYDTVQTNTSLSELYSELNKPPTTTSKRTLRPLPFSYEDPDAPQTIIPTEYQEDEETTGIMASLFPHAYGGPGPKTIPVLLMSGKTLHIKRKPPKRQAYSKKTYTSEVTYDEDGNREVKDSYYGVAIHKLIDEIQAERTLAEYAKEKSREVAGISESGLIQTDSIPYHVPPPPQPALRQQRTLLWTEKYRAKRFTDLLGDERTHRQVLRWLKHWDDIVFPGLSSGKRKNNNTETDEHYFHKKILLITGPPGLGKTTLAHVAARQAGYEPLEINASDDRTASVVKGKIRDALSNEGVRIPGIGKKKGIGSSRPVCVVVDEIDGISGGGGESGFMSALVDLILQDQKNSASAGFGADTTKKRRKGKKDNFKFHRPIIAICNDLYAPSLRPLRPLAEIVYMRKPPTGLMVQRLKWVFEREGVPCEDAAIRRLVELSTSGSTAQATSGGGGGGDMRGCLVSGEWLAKRLLLTSTTTTTTTTSTTLCAKLTRKIVEAELEGSEGSTGASRGGIRGCVERVFRKGDESTRKGAARSGGLKLSSTEARRREWDSLREEVECCGEFDKIMTDVFATYLTRPYNDDTRLSKPNMAYEWLWFHDMMSSRVFSEQEWELSGYLGVPPMAFNCLFGTSSATAGHGAFMTSATRAGAGGDDEDPDSLPFQGPKADYDYREKLKANKTIIQAIHSNFLTPPGSTGPRDDTSYISSPASIRLAAEFHSPTSLTAELAPYLTRILSPRVNPILIHGSGPNGISVASVRKDTEKLLVRRAVEVMYTTNITFEKVRVEFSGGPSGLLNPAATGGNTMGWAYCMDPPLDQLSTFPTLTGRGAGDNPVPIPTRYATRQVLAQELHKYTILQRQSLRDARRAKLGLGSASVDAGASLLGAKMGRMKVVDDTQRPHNPARGLKRDFFGRLVVEETRGQDGGEGGGAAGAKRRKGEEAGVRGGGKVYVSFHEGFSNAVKKGITLEELMGGLY